MFVALNQTICTVDGRDIHTWVEFFTFSTFYNYFCLIVCKNSTISEKQRYDNECKQTKSECSAYAIHLDYILNSSTTVPNCQANAMHSRTSTIVICFVI